MGEIEAEIPASNGNDDEPADFDGHWENYSIFRSKLDGEGYHLILEYSGGIPY